MTYRRVMVTGHRPEDFDETEIYMTIEWLKGMAEWLKADHGTTHAIGGMALGVDTWWFLKAREAGLLLDAHVPFWAQARRWAHNDRVLWSELLSDSVDVKVYGKSEPYNASLFFERNSGMVAEADLALVVWSGRQNGGTYHAFKEINKAGLPWIWYDYKNNRVETSEGLV